MSERTLALAEFLLARIADQERSAQALADVRTMLDDRRREITPDVRNGAEFVFQEGRLNPARVLAECEAKRRIVNRARGWLDETPDGTSTDVIARDLLWHVVRCLALPYADHPAYDEAWRP